MRRNSRATCSTSTVVAALLSVGVAGCGKGAELVTSIKFDGESRSITTRSVTCAKQPDGGLVIMVTNGPRHSVRIQLTERGQIRVQKVGLRYDDMAGFVADPAEVTATKVDDAFTFSGRMPPNAGESQWHTFNVETTCPGYTDARPGTQVPALGVP